MPAKRNGQRNGIQPTRFVVIVAASIISALVLAAAYPVMSLLAGLAIAFASVIFLVSRDVRAFLGNHAAFIVRHPKFGQRMACAAAYGILLLCASISRLLPSSQNRPAVQSSSNSSDPAALIRKGDLAFDIGDLEEATQLVRRLEGDPTALNRDDFKRLQQKLRQASLEKETRRANDRVLRLMIDANQDFLAKRFQKVDSALRAAFAVAGATDLKEATALANRLFVARVAAAEERLNAGDLAAVEGLIKEADGIPNIREKQAIADLQLKLVNARVLERAALAQKRAEENQWPESEAELNAAIALKNASDLADPGNVHAKAEAERLSESNGTAAQKPGLASQFVFVKSRMDEEGNILEVYAVEGSLNVENLKSLCQQKQHRTKAKSAYFLVLFDDPVNAAFPSTQFRDRFGTDDSARRHIRAIYEFNRANGYSELEYYDTNVVDGRLRREHI